MSPWYEPKDRTPRHPCPCCDYVSLPERGMDLICPLCFWEDDAFLTDQDLDSRSTPNHMTLRQARENFRLFGACDKAMLDHVLPAETRQLYEYRPRTS